MTSKSFKGLLSANELNVVGYGDSSQVDLLIRRSDRAITSTGIAITPSDAPALALAILEAAGVEATPMATSVAFGTVVADLQRLIAEQERATAEAREREELEAEALELVNGYRTSMGDPTVASFDGFSAQRVTGWLAVARRAREMRTEK